MVQYLPFVADVLEVHGEIGSTGHVEIDIEIDGVPVTGMEGATFTSSGESYTGTALNNAATGAKLTASVVGATLDPDGLCLTIITERTGGGAVTTNWKGALVRKNANQTLTTGVSAPVTWNTELYDVSSWFATPGDAHFTVPSGVTRVSIKANGRFSSSAIGRRELILTRDTGGGFLPFPGSGSGVFNAVGTDASEFHCESAIIDVQKGHKFRVEAFQNSGGNLDLEDDDRTWFQIEAVQGNILGATGATGPAGNVDITTVSGTTTLGINDGSFIDVTAGGFVITLPAVAAAAIGKIFHIKDSDGNAGSSSITIDGNGAELINGSTTFSLTVSYQSVSLVNIGDKWVTV
jgi:hypothetical protein